MIGGISLKVYGAPYWEEIRDAYLEAAEQPKRAQREPARTLPKRRSMSDRFKAAWGELVD